MSLAALPDLLLSWVKNQGAALLRSDKAPSPADVFKPGQQYEGKVLDSLANGRHLVRVAGQNLDMNLPRGAQTGDSVRLTFVNSGPRPTFLLNTAPVTPVQQVRLSQAAQQVNALMRLAAPAPAMPSSSGVAATHPSPTLAAAAATLAAAPAASARASVSPGAPTAALASVSTAAPAATVAPASTTAPVSTVTPGATAASALAIAGRAAATAPAAMAQAAALAAKGGEAIAAAARPIVVNVDILRNYSAAFRLTPAPVASANTGLVGQAVDGLRAAMPGNTTLRPGVLAEMPSPSRQMLPIQLSQTLRESGMFYESHLARWSKGTMTLAAIQREPQARLALAGTPVLRMAELAGMPEEAARLAGRQLQMLEGAPFQWQGQVWPGQMLNWQVRERTDGEAGNGGEEGRAADWETELSLTLPRLGEVRARLGLSGARLDLRLVATEEATREAMREALPHLLEGLRAAGLEPAGVLVEPPRG